MTEPREVLALQSIAKERAACEAAWAAVPDATAGAHIHHEAPLETLTGPIANRIAYIASDKPKEEQALRYRLMRPITAEQWAEYERARAAARVEYRRVEAAALAEYKRAIKAIHDTICPTTDCPFDGSSIFAEGSR